MRRRVNIAARIREVIHGLEEFTSDDVYDAVKEGRDAMTLGASVNYQIWLAAQRGEIIETGRRNLGSRRIVKVWRRAAHTDCGHSSDGNGCPNCGAADARSEEK